MPKDLGLRHAALIERVTTEAKTFFEKNPNRSMFAAYLGDTDKGAWAYLVFGRDVPYGAFDFEPPSGEFTREQFTTLLNTLPRGEQVMKDCVDKVGGTLRAGIDEYLQRLLARVPTSPTQH